MAARDHTHLKGCNHLWNPDLTQGSIICASLAVPEGGIEQVHVPSATLCAVDQLLGWPRLLVVQIITRDSISIQKRIPDPIITMVSEPESVNRMVTPKERRGKD